VPGRLFQVSAEAWLNERRSKYVLWYLKEVLVSETQSAGRLIDT